MGAEDVEKAEPASTTLSTEVPSKLAVAAKNEGTADEERTTEPDTATASALPGPFVGSGRPSDLSKETLSVGNAEGSASATARDDLPTEMLSAEGRKEFKSDESVAAAKSAPRDASASTEKAENLSMDTKSEWPSKTTTVPESVSKTTTEPELGAETAAETELVSVAALESKQGDDTKTDPQSVSKPAIEPQSASKAASEPDPVSKATSELEAVSKIALKPGVVASKTASELEAAASKTKLDPQVTAAMSAPGPEAASKMASEPEAASKSVSEAEAVSKTVSEPEAVNSEAAASEPELASQKASTHEAGAPKTASEPDLASKNELESEPVPKTESLPAPPPPSESTAPMEGLTRPDPDAPARTWKRKTPEKEDQPKDPKGSIATDKPLSDAPALSEPVENKDASLEMSKASAEVPSMQEASLEGKNEPSNSNSASAESGSGNSKNVDMLDIEEKTGYIMEEDENDKGNESNEVKESDRSEDFSAKPSDEAGKDVPVAGKSEPWESTRESSADRKSPPTETAVEASECKETKTGETEREGSSAGAAPVATKPTVNAKQTGSSLSEALAGDKTECESDKARRETEVTEEEDMEIAERPQKKPRRSSSRTPVQPRATRSSRGSTANGAVPGTVSDLADGSENSSTRYISKPSEKKEEREEEQIVDAGDGAEQAHNEQTPRPKQTPDGLQMKVGETLFVEVDKLTDMKQKRMKDKKLKPIEELTFDDIRGYNRDQLRCYCYIYGTPRRKKIEMEADMARFVSLWNEGRPGYIFSEYVPNNPRNNVAVLATVLASTASSTGVGQSEIGRSNAGDRMEVDSGSLPNRSSPGNTNMKTEQRSAVNRGNHEHEKNASGDDDSKTNAIANNDFKALEKSSTRPGFISPARSSAKTANTSLAQSSTKRPPVRASASGNIQPVTIKPNLASRSPSTERLSSMSRGSSPAAIAPNSAPSNPTQNQNGALTPGATPATIAGRASTAKGTKSTLPIQPMPKGLGTSFKQKVHARTAGAKYKAAYNGAGPAIVNIVENAAAYFEGKDSPETISDQAKSFERYQFNVDLLSEIFDGAPPETNIEGADPGSGDSAKRDRPPIKNSLLQDVAKRMRSRTRDDIAVELHMVEESVKKLESETKVAERANMRMFQRLERAETEEEIEDVKRDFEREHNVRFENSPPPLVRRKLDKSLPPLVMSDDQCRILRFKVA